MIKTIVTGANGFIGAHLIKKLNNVLLLEHGDIIYGHSFNAERMFFLSTYGNMAHHVDHRMTVKANAQDLITVLRGFTGWMCYMSSSSVLLPVATPYSHAKRAGEQILLSLPGLRSCIVRPYSVTGVGEQKEHLIPTLIRSCLLGEKMLFDPDPVHDFVDVDDVVNVLISLADKQATGIHEIGRGYAYTNQEVRELVEFVCGKKANLSHTGKLRDYDNSEWYCRNPFIHDPKPLFTSIQEMVEAFKRESA